jgi:hypothetical protein
MNWASHGLIGEADRRSIQNHIDDEPGERCDNDVAGQYEWRKKCPSQCGPGRECLGSLRLDSSVRQRQGSIAAAAKPNFSHE